MESQDREALIRRLQKETEEYFANLKPSEYKDGWSEDNWEKEMEEHPLFATNLPEGDEMPPLIEALQQLKYDPSENSPVEVAQSYKEDGNENFKVKKYKLAVAAYTEGLKQKCDDSELNATLYCNRAAAQYHLENYGSSLRDALAAQKLKPDYTKAVIRAAHCCWQLKNLGGCIDWCTYALTLSPGNAAMVELREKAEKQMKIEERNQRKEAAKLKHAEKTEQALMTALKERKITLCRNIPKEDPLAPKHPALSDHRVHMSEDDKQLIWPVIFLYPEVMESDMIQQFPEISDFASQLQVMFSDPQSQPTWNENLQYSPSDLQVWFKDRHTGKPVFVKETSTLKQVLSDERMEVAAGTPQFWITKKDSDYEKQFLAQQGKDN